MNTRAQVRLVSLMTGMLLACSNQQDIAPPPGPTSEVEVQLPREPGPFVPSFARLADGETFDPQPLVQSQACGPCHATVVEEWKGSVHALSSFNNPFYRVVFDEFVGQTERSKGNHCGGCHDPALLFDGSLKREVDPADPRAYAGLGCAHCHGITEVSAEGNGSYVLSTAPIPLPVDGDPASLAAHRARVAGPALRSDTFCLSCHRGFLNGGTGHETLLLGNDEAGVWRRSAYGGSQAERIDPSAQKKSCVDCHMPRVDGPATSPGGNLPQHRTHTFAGGHTALADWAGARDQHQAIEAQLKQAAQLYVVPLEMQGALTVPGGGKIDEDGGWKALLFDTVIVNEGVGHRFPGGARDLRDTWVEVEVFDDTGVKVAAAGDLHAATGEDSSAHRLRVLVADDEGQAVMEHTISSLRTPVYDNTIAPRDAVSARYMWRLPSGWEQRAFQVRVKLNHRRLHLPAAHAACEGSKTPRGQAFLLGTEQAMGWKVDPCRPEEVLEIARAETWIGGGKMIPLDSQVLYHHAQAVSKQVVERLPDVLYDLERAEKLLPPDSPPERLWALHLEKARVLARQNRYEEATTLLMSLSREAPDQPAVYFALGEAWARVWKWPEAIAAYERAAALAPRDDRLWRALAIAQLSALDYSAALETTRHGLDLEPRDAALLRTQMLAVEHLAPGSENARKSRETYLTYRPDDLAPRVRSKCSKTSPDCQLERVPVHIHPLHAPGAGQNLPEKTP